VSWLNHLWRRSPLYRVALGGALLAALLLLPLPASGGVIWDIGMGAGYCALVTAATLYLFPLRGDGLPHRRLFTLAQHKVLGWIALGLCVLHIAILWISQPLVWRYLWPSTPIYMLCGIAALIALLVLTITGLVARAAHRQAKSANKSKYAHLILAAILLALIAGHIVGSRQLLDRPSKVITLCVLLGLPLVWTAFRPRRPRSIRFSTTVLPTCVALVALLILPIPLATPKLQASAVRPTVLPVNFPHDKHTTVNCVTCHHNFADQSGVTGGCLACHRSDRSDLPQAAEPLFHTFCRSCHVELAQTTQQHGPTRSCSTCHVTQEHKGPMTTWP
jgi:predicted CXXCH cytochrome family protein